MITDEKIAEFRKLLDESERPLFFFDDDPDGLCSFLLLKKYAGRGKGVVVKGSPVLSAQYCRKIEEIRPDRVFVLDKPVLGQDFVDEAKVQVVWLDHHPVVEVSGVHYFNPRFTNPDDNSPTAYWAYRIACQKKNMWLAMAGCIGDWYIPDFAEEFSKKYPGMLSVYREPGQVLYDTKIGLLSRVLSSILKGSTTDVAKCISALEKVQEPEEILEETTSAGKYVMKYHKKVTKTYEKLLEKAMAVSGKSDFLEFTYPMTKMSFSGDIANELLYRLPGKFIIIGRVKNDSVAISMRSKGHIIPPILKIALEGLEGYGGGHDHACGGSISIRDFPVLVERLRKAVKGNN